MDVIFETPDVPPEEMPRIYPGQWVSTPKGDGLLAIVNEIGVVVQLTKGGYYTGKAASVRPK